MQSFKSPTTSRGPRFNIPVLCVPDRAQKRPEAHDPWAAWARITKNEDAMKRLAVLLALTLNGCQGGAVPATMPTSAASTAAATPTERATAVASLDDPRGDVDGPAYIDIVGFDAKADGDDVTFTLEVAAAPPTDRSAREEEITYLILAGTRGVLAGDLWLTLENSETGAWDAQLTDFDPPGSVPGIATVDGKLIQGRISVTRLGEPTTVFMCAVAETRDPVMLTRLADGVPREDCIGAGRGVELSLR
jgi:hypothetical protein